MLPPEDSRTLQPTDVLPSPFTLATKFTLSPGLICASCGATVTDGEVLSFPPVPPVPAWPPLPVLALLPEAIELPAPVPPELLLPPDASETDASPAECCWPVSTELSAR